MGRRARSPTAQAAAEVLAKSGCEVTVLPPENVGAVEEFDAVVLGSAVYMGRWMKPRANSWNASPKRSPVGP